MGKDNNQMKRRISTGSEKSSNDNEEFLGISRQIVENSLEMFGAIVGLGSGGPINTIAAEFAKQANKVKERELKIVCTKEWMMRYLLSNGVPAFMYPDEHTMPELNAYIETINYICCVNNSVQPVCIKSDATSQFSGAMLKKAKSAVLIQTNSCICGTTIRGIPLDIENNSTGWALFKDWEKKRGGKVALRSNIEKTSDRFHVEWVPPMNWETEGVILRNRTWDEHQRELDSTPGVLSHNLFASENCLLVNLDSFETDFKNVMKMMAR